jgi:hypothetical protein
VLTCPHILEETAHVDSHTIIDAVTAFDLCGYFEPIRQCKVNRLGYVKTLVKASMVPLAAGDHKLPLPVDHFGHSDPVIDQEPWIYQRRLVPDKLRALFCLLWILRFEKFLEMSVAVEVYSIPEFRPSMMQVVDRVKVKVLLMPTEHGLPGPDVNIRGVDSRDLLTAKPLSKRIVTFK